MKLHKLAPQRRSLPIDKDTSIILLLLVALLACMLSLDLERVARTEAQHCQSASFKALNSWFILGEKELILGLVA
jgi:hypothetical protein